MDFFGAHEIIRSDRGTQNSQKEQEKGTRKVFVVVIVPNEENVRNDNIGGTRKVFAVILVPNDENVRKELIELGWAQKLRYNGSQ